jgi:hypothetical protein
VIGKFKFLNELIKLVSTKVCASPYGLHTWALCPRYVWPIAYGNDATITSFCTPHAQYYTDTPEPIKRRILGMIQDWKNTLNQPKITEAYEMLKRQGHDFPLDAVTDAVPVNDRNVCPHR